MSQEISRDQEIIAPPPGNRMPVLPLRDVVVYPHMVIPLFVGREKSILALDAAMQVGKQIVLVAQKQADVDEPEMVDLFDFGTLATILQLLKLPDGTVKVLVEGNERVALQDLREEEYFTAEIEVLADHKSNGARNLRLHLASARRAPILRLQVETEGGIIRSLSLPDGRPRGQRLQIGEQRLRLRCVAPPADGLELGLELESGGSLSIEIEDRSFGLPELEPPLEPRPPATMAKPYGYSDLTRVHRAIELAQ